MTVSNSPKLLDDVRAHEISDLLRQSSPTAYKRMLDNFARDLEQFASALRAHVADAPQDGIKRMTHSLKGASQTLGAQALGELFVDLEHLASMGDIPAIVLCHADNGLLIEQTLAALRWLDVTT